MFKLIGLELRKNKMKPFLYALIGIFIFSFGFCVLTSYIPKIEVMNSSAAAAGADLTMFTEWKNFILLMLTLIFASFSVLSATMHARFTIEEYTGKRSILLFSYPQKRSRILFAKVGFVSMFTIIANAVCSIIVISLFGLLSNLTGINQNPFTSVEFMIMLKNALIFSFLSASVGVVALRIGIWKKSMIATIVTAVMIIVPFSNMASLLPDSSFTILLVGLGILIAIGVITFARLLAKVNKMEAV